jgi:NTE family protein
MKRRALVLGGGGLAGIAWETGNLTGLADAGTDVLDPDLVVGTSAGSTVGATIGARRHVDGGVRSNENADLVTGHDRVLVLSPQPPGAPVPPRGGLDEEAGQLRRRGSDVAIVRPDEESTAAMGLNPLDPAVRAPTARAGREQGRREAARVASVWG